MWENNVTDKDRDWSKEIKIEEVNNDINETEMEN